MANMSIHEYLRLAQLLKMCNSQQMPVVRYIKPSSSLQKETLRVDALHRGIARVLNIHVELSDLEQALSRMESVQDLAKYLVALPRKVLDPTTARMLYSSLQSAMQLELRSYHVVIRVQIPGAEGGVVQVPLRFRWDPMTTLPAVRIELAPPDLTMDDAVEQTEFYQTVADFAYAYGL